MRILHVSLTIFFGLILSYLLCFTFDLLFPKTRQHLRCNFLFVLIGDFGILKDINISFFLAFFFLTHTQLSLLLLMVQADQGLDNGLLTRNYKEVTVDCETTICCAHRSQPCAPEPCHLCHRYITTHYLPPSQVLTLF